MIQHAGTQFPASLSNVTTGTVLALKPVNSGLVQFREWIFQSSQPEGGGEGVKSDTMSFSASSSRKGFRLMRRSMFNFRSFVSAIFFIIYVSVTRKEEGE